jgi:hypothetical protein
MSVSGDRDEAGRCERAGDEGEGVVDDGVEMAAQGFPPGATTTPHQSRLSWALQWLPEDNSRSTLSLQIRATKGPAILAQHVACVSPQPYSLNLFQSYSRHRCSGTPQASTKAGNGSGNAAMDWQEWLQCHIIPDTRALYAVPTLQLWVWTQDCQTYHHPETTMSTCLS